MLDRNKNNKTNCIKTNASCIIWDMDPIPCLGIERGDYLDDVVFAIVRKICEREDEFDLSSITLAELIERFNITEPAEKTVHTLLQLCVDNDVRLHKLFTQLRDSIPGASGGFVLDLKCFKKLDSYGNQVPYDEQTVLQDLINEACLIRDEFDDLKEYVESLGDGEGGVYTEPIITETCIFENPTTPKKLSAYVTEFASKFCEYKGKIGTISAWNETIGRQGGTETQDSGWVERMQTDPNFVPFPQTAAQSVSNLWMATNNVNARLEELEACACKVTCKDLGVGFGVVPTDAGVVLEFAPQYGNSVNEVFSLTGDNNKVSFTDKNDKRMTFNITSLANEDTAGPYNIAALAQDGIIKINVCVAFTTPTGEYCNKCVNDIYDPNTNMCNFCEIKATDEVTIMYKTCATTETGINDCAIKTMRLMKGEEAALRKSYSVVYVSDANAIEGLECLNFGEYDDVKCWIVGISSITNVQREISGIRYKGSDYMFGRNFAREQANNVGACYPVTEIAMEMIRIMPNLLQANGNCITTKTTYKRVPTALSGLTGWPLFTKKVVDTEHKASFLQVLAPEEVMKELFLIARTADIDGGQSGTEDDTFGYFYLPFTPRENYEGYDAQDSILPPSLC